MNKNKLTPKGVLKAVNKLLEIGNANEARDLINKCPFDEKITNDKDASIVAELWKVRDLINAGVLKKASSIKEQKKLIGKLDLSRYFKKIKAILKEYMDMKERTYTIASLWILGTYLHKQFSSYPYLYFNAMKGSGKTRMLKIIANLSKNGKLQGAITKAGIFRSKGTYCIDEFEGVGRKGNEDLRELLNGAYKRGSIITRYDDVKKKPEGEEFNIYRPIALANIWGMENVLADRCISETLEKSSNKRITRKIENFENNNEFQTIRKEMLNSTENIDDNLNCFGNVFEEWNNFVDKKEVDKKFKEMFSIIGEEIEGRNLELFLPLFIIADKISQSVLKEIVEISKQIIKERKEADREENRDIQIYEFVSQYQNKDFVAPSDLVKEFKEYFEIGDNETWANATWFGRGLRRLNLVVDKRKLTRKRLVKLNIEKAKEKIKIFRDPEELDFKEEFQEVFKDG